MVASLPAIAWRRVNAMGSTSPESGAESGLWDLALVGDVGGTNLRLAVNDGGRLGHCLYQVADELPDLESGIARYLECTGVKPKAACLAVAGPVLGDTVQITNRPWRFSIEALRRRFGLDCLIILNDFQALATALPALAAADLAPVGAGPARLPACPMTVLGPGTGLGVAGLVPVGAAWLPVPGEGGHTAFAASTEREWAVVRALAPRFGGRISNERLLCGSGLSLLHEGLALVDGVAQPMLPADAITRQGLDGSCQRCRETLDMFLGALGAFAGDMVLTFAATGGAFIGGGIVPRLLDIIPQSPFRARFDAKGPEMPFVAKVPCHIIVSPDATLLGALHHLLGRPG